MLHLVSRQPQSLYGTLSSNRFVELSKGTVWNPFAGPSRKAFSKSTAELAGQNFAYCGHLVTQQLSVAGWPNAVLFLISRSRLLRRDFPCSAAPTGNMFKISRKAKRCADKLNKQHMELFAHDRSTRQALSSDFSGPATLFQAANNCRTCSCLAARNTA